MPETAEGFLRISHLILTVTLERQAMLCATLIFTSEDFEAQRGGVTCPRSPS